MVMDNNGDDHQPAGRPDGGQYAPKAGRNADDIPAGTTLTDMAFDDDALAEYMEDLDAGDKTDSLRALADDAVIGAATPTERADRELGIMEDLAISRMRTTDDRDSLHRAMGFASAIIDARDMLRR